MSRKKKGHDEGHADESWLLPYSDMMTLLLALFIVMFASSTVDEAKYNAVMEAMYTAFGGTSDIGNPIDIGTVGDFTGGSGEHEVTFEDLYSALIDAVKNSGNSSNIDVIKGDNSITIHFSDSVLFMPNSPMMTSGGDDVLKTIGSIFSNLDQLIGHIEIGGHTAFIGEEADRTMEAWELSSDRAIAVLRYFAFDLGLDQSKLSMAGYSHFVPVASNDTEEGRSKNRRVDLFITPEAGHADTVSQALSPETSEQAGSEEAAQPAASEQTEAISGEAEQAEAESSKAH